MGHAPPALPAIRSDSGLNRPFTFDQFAAVAAGNGVTGSILVEAASAGAEGLAETLWLLEQTRTGLVRGFCDVVVGWPLG